MSLTVQRLRAVRLVVGEHAVADLDRGGNVEPRGRIDRARLQRARRGDDLRRRARLERIGEDSVARRRWRRARRVPPGRTVDLGHRQDVAGAHVRHHGHPVLRPDLGDLGDEVLLDLVLQRLVEREHEVAAGLGRRLVLVGRGNHPPARVPLLLEPSRPTGEHRVVRGLEPTATAAVGHRADHRAGERAAGGEPLVLGDEPDARVAELADRGGDIGIDLRGEADVASARCAQLGLEPGGVRAPAAARAGSRGRSGARRASGRRTPSCAAARARAAPRCGRGSHHGARRASWRRRAAVARARPRAGSPPSGASPGEPR